MGRNRIRRVEVESWPPEEPSAFGLRVESDGWAGPEVEDEVSEEVRKGSG
jgi:hypothetical protein